MLFSKYLHETKLVSKIAIPIILSSISFVGMEFADSAMAGHYSAIDLAGLAISVSFLIAIKLPINGFLVGLTPILSRDHGENNKQALIEHFKQAIVLSFFLMVITAIFILGACYSYGFLSLEPQVLDVARKYTLIITLGIPGFFLFNVLVALAEGLSSTKIMIFISFLGLSLNVLFNYLFIYGFWIVPQLGAIGCAIATVLCQYFMALAMWLCMRKMSCFSWVIRAVDNLKPDWSTLKNYYKIGLPVTVSMFFEISFFTYCSVLVSSLGTAIIAANQIFYNLMTIIYMLPFSLSHVASIRVGYCIGQRDMEKVKITSLVCLGLGVICAIVVAILSYIYRFNVAQIYTNDPEVIALVIGAFWIVSLYQVGDYCQNISIGILRGMLDNRFIVFGAAVYWIIGAPSALILGFTSIFGGNYGFTGVWFALCLTLYILAFLYTSRVAVSYRRLKLSYQKGSV